MENIKKIKKKINVALFGGKSVFKNVKDNPLRAEIIYCECPEKCPMYSRGTCVLHGLLFTGCKCTHGKKEIIKGYLPKAKKYKSFYEKYKNDEMYCKLHQINSNILFEVTPDGYYLHISYANTKKDVLDNENKLVFCDPFSEKALSINFIIRKELLDVDTLYNLCKFQPYALMGGVIENYRQKEVPEFLYQLSKLDIDLYKALLDKYKNELESFGVLKINHVGKDALLKTLNTGKIKIKDREFDFDGEYLYSNSYSNPFVFNGIPCEIKMKVPDDYKVEVLDNSWVNENTVFV